MILKINDKNLLWNFCCWKAQVLGEKKEVEVKIKFKTIFFMSEWRIHEKL